MRIIASSKNLSKKEIRCGPKRAVFFGNEIAESRTVFVEKYNRALKKVRRVLMDSLKESADELAFKKKIISGLQGLIKEEPKLENFIRLIDRIL
jgi:hypothetical protein